MSKYVLGENAARKLKALFNGKMSAGRTDGSSGGIVDDSAFPMPFTVQWAASLATAESSEGAGDATSGEWIIWLPGDEHIVLGTTAIDLSEDLDAAGGDYPTGWFKLGDLLDPDEGGTLYLEIDTSSTTPTAELSASAGTGTSIKVCVASVSSDGSRAVKSMLTSALVVGGGSSGSNKYYADEFSLSQMDTSSARSNVYQIKGFGRYAATIVGSADLGTFQASSELSLEENEPTSIAFLCRSGNSDVRDYNYLVYKTLKFSGTPSPFKYTKTTTTDPTTQETTTTHKLVNCTFYWKGELKTLADYDVSGVIANGTVYLRGTAAAASASTPDPEWTWTVGTAEETAPSGGKALNFKLYDFAASKPTVDYRDAFLMIPDSTQPAKLTIGRPDSDATIVLDATGDEPKIVVTGVSGNTITFDLTEVDSSCSGTFGMHKITWKQKDASGTTETQEAHFFGCYDVDLSDVAGGTEISLGSDNYHLVKSGNKTTGYTLSVPKITFEFSVNEGYGIGVTSGDKSATVRNLGVVRMKGDQSAFLVNGNVTVGGAAGSGLISYGVTGGSTGDYNDGSVLIDVDGRSSTDSMSLCEVKVQGQTDPVAKVFGTSDFEITQKELKAGFGIKLEEKTEDDTAKIEISVGDENTFTGTKTVVVDVDYDSSSHSLRKKTATLEFQNGLLKTWTEDSSLVAYTTAVEES